jgi:predicted acyl esterase
MSAPIYANVRAANAFWGGWYDLFQVGTLAAFEGYNTLSDPSVRGQSIITVDPLGHCLEGAEFFTENAVEGRTILVMGQLFQTYGIFPVKRPNIKNVTFYVMSSNDEAGREAGQYWTSLDTWPKHRAVDYFLHSDKTASTNVGKPTQDPVQTRTSYVFDPANPVPTMGGSSF